MEAQFGTLQEELEKVQNRAARFVGGNFETGSNTGILGQLKWESLKKRRKDSVTQRKAVARIYLRSQDGRGRFPACQGYVS